MRSYQIIGVGRLPRRSRTTVLEFLGQAIVILFILIAVLAAARAARAAGRLVTHLGEGQPAIERTVPAGNNANERDRPAASSNAGQR
jgi:hypothetical protein